MKATDGDLKDALRRQERRRGPGRVACPSPEALARAGEGAADRPPIEIADHLAHCTDCAFEYRLASALRPWAEGAAETLPGPARRPRGLDRLLPAALAASVVLCLGLVGWVLSLQDYSRQLQARLTDADQALLSTRREASAPVLASVPPASSSVTAVTLPQPHANVPLVDLFPRDAARGASRAQSTVDVAESPYVVLILNVREPAAGATYAVEILDASGSAVWSSDAVRAGTEPLTLGLPSTLLAGESYLVRLHRVRGGRRTLAEQYDIRVKRPRPGTQP